MIYGDEVAEQFESQIYVNEFLGILWQFSEFLLTSAHSIDTNFDYTAM